MQTYTHFRTVFDVSPAAPMDNAWVALVGQVRAWVARSDRPLRRRTGPDTPFDTKCDLSVGTVDQWSCPPSVLPSVNRLPLRWRGTTFLGTRPYS